MKKTQFTTSTLFTDNMVLQHGEKITVWGTAESGATVTLSFDSQKIVAETNTKGEWQAVFTPFDISVVPKNMIVSCKKSKEEIVLKNIVVGDVWVCSGQSNMQFNVFETQNSAKEIETAHYPNIRMYTVPQTARIKAPREMNSNWVACSPDTVEFFSSVGYFYARKIHKETGIPIGMIHTSWGGTCAEAWTSRETLYSHSKFKKLIEQCDLELDPDYNQLSEQAIKYAYWAENYDHKDTVNAGEEAGWHLLESSISNWDNMELPQSWQSAGHNVSGIFWFSKEIELTEPQAEMSLVLSLGPIDKSDVTYVNGVRVGSVTYEERSDSWCFNRVYKIPKGVLRAGANRITVRAFSNIFDGGFRGEPSMLKLESQQEKDQLSMSLAGVWRYKIEADFGFIPLPPPPPFGEGNQNTPTILYNNMIRPLLRYKIKGFIWYQGESNEARAKDYAILFPLLIQCWRESWKKKNLPFYFVQLAGFRPQKSYDPNSTWAILRESQGAALSLPYTGMAVTTDLGDASDIHPTNKQGVGYRLALLALNGTYGFKKRVCNGPIYKTAKSEKNKMRLFFDSLGGGLVAHGEKLTGFAIAGSDKQFREAEAYIDGESIVVSNSEIESPKAVRYGWADNPICNLYNAADLPASPFRTDRW